MKTVIEEVLDTLSAQPDSKAVRFRFRFSTTHIQDALHSVFPAEQCFVKATSDPFVFEIQRPKEKPPTFSTGPSKLDEKQQECLAMLSELAPGISQIKQAVAKCQALLGENENAVNQDKKLMEVSALVAMLDAIVKNHEDNADVLPETVNTFYKVLNIVCAYEWRDLQFATAMASRFNELMDTVIKLNRETPYQSGVWTYLQRGVQLIVGEINERNISLYGDEAMIKSMDQIELYTLIDKELTAKVKGITEMMATYTTAEFLDYVAEMSFEDPNFTYYDSLPRGFFEGQEYSSEEEEQEDLARVMYNLHDACMKRLNKAQSISQVQGDQENVAYCERTRLLVDKLLQTALDKMPPLPGTGFRAMLDQESVQLKEQLKTLRDPDIDKRLKDLSKHGDDVATLVPTLKYIRKLLQELEDIAEPDIFGKEPLENPAREYELQKLCCRALYFLNVRINGDHKVKSLDFITHLPKTILPRIDPGTSIVYKLPEYNLPKDKDFISAQSGEYQYYTEKGSLPNVPYADRIEKPPPSSYSDMVMFSIQFPITREQASTLVLDPQPSGNIDYILHRSDPLFEEKQRLAAQIGKKLWDEADNSNAYVQVTFQSSTLYGKDVAPRMEQESKNWRQAFKMLDFTMSPDPRAQKRFHAQSYSDAKKFIDFVEAELKEWERRLADKRALYDEELAFLRKVPQRRKRKISEPAVDQFEVKDAKQLKTLLATTRTEEAMMNSFTFADYLKGSVLPFLITAQSLYMGFSAIANVANYTAQQVGRFMQPVEKPVKDIIVTPEKSVDMLRQDPKPSTLADRFTDWSQFTPSPVNPTYAQVKRQTEAIGDVFMKLTNKHVYTTVASNLRTTDLTNALDKIDKINEKELGEQAVKAQKTLKLLRTPFTEVGLDVVDVEGLTKDSSVLTFQMCTDFLMKNKNTTQTVEDFFQGDRVLKMKRFYLASYLNNVPRGVSLKQLSFSQETFQSLVTTYNEDSGFRTPEGLGQFKLQLRLHGFESAVSSAIQVLRNMRTTPLRHNEATKTVEEVIMEAYPQLALMAENMKDQSKGDRLVINEFIDSFKGAQFQMDSLPKKVDDLLQKLFSQRKEEFGLEAPIGLGSGVELLSVLLGILFPIYLLYERGTKHDTWAVATSLLFARLFMPMMDGIRQRVIDMANMKSRRGSGAYATNAQVEEIENLMKQQTTVAPSPGVSLPLPLRMWNGLQETLFRQGPTVVIPDDLEQMVQELDSYWPRIKKRNQLGLTAAYRTNLRALRQALTRREFLQQSTRGVTSLETKRFLRCIWMTHQIVEDNDNFITAMVKRGSFLFRTGFSYISSTFPMFSTFFSAYVTYNLWQLRLPSFASAYIPPYALTMFGLKENLPVSYVERVLLFSTVPETLMALLGIGRDLVDMATGSDLEVAMGVRESWDAVDTMFEESFMGAVASSLRGSAPFGQVLGERLISLIKDVPPSLLLKKSFLEGAKNVGLGLFFYSGPLVEAIRKTIDAMNPNVDAALINFFASGGTTKLPSEEHMVAYISTVALKMTNYATRIFTALDVDDKDIEKKYKLYKAMETIIPIMNDSRTLLWGVTTVAICLSIASIPFVQNTIQKIYTGGPSRILYEVANTSVVGPTRSLFMPWYLSKMAASQNQIIKQYKQNNELYMVYSAVKYLRNELEANAQNNSVPILTQLPSLPEDFERVQLPRRSDFDRDWEDFEPLRQTMKWSRMADIIDRVSKSPALKMKPVQVKDMVYDNFMTVLNKLGKHCDFALKLFHQIIYSEKNMKSYQDITEEMVDILGTDPTLNKYKALLDKGKNLDMLKDIAKTWQFWDNLIKQQQKLYGIYVEFCTSILGQDETYRIFDFAGLTSSGLSLLGNFLKLYMLGEWVQMALQFYFPETLLTQLEGAPEWAQKIFTPYETSVSLKETDKISGDSLTSVLVTIRRDPSSRVCKDLAQTRKALGSLAEAIRSYTNIESRETDLLEYCARGYPVLTTTIVVPGLDATVPLSNAISKTFTEVLGESMELIHKMAPHTIISKYDELQKELEKE